MSVTSATEVPRLVPRSVKMTTQQSMKTAIVEDVIGAHHPTVVSTLGMLQDHVR